MKQNAHHGFPRRCSRRGFTMAEMMVATAIFSMVMTAVLGLQIITARTLKDLYAPTRSRSARTSALNQLRFRLCEGQIGSCVVPAEDEGRRIQFVDPNQGGATSEFFFDADQDILYYDNDISDANDPEVVAEGLLSVRFALGRETSPGLFEFLDNLVTLYVETSDDLSRWKVDERDGETVVYLRNQSV